MSDISYFQYRAILAPKNSLVEQINDYVLKLIPGEEQTYEKRFTIFANH